jgi:hypothetical protein
MRKIVAVRLENDTTINIIANVKKPEEARNLAAKHFARLIGDKNYEITNSSKIISSEDWEQSRVSTSQNGNKLYKVAFYLNNVTQCIDISAVSVKSAYNNVKIKFGIEENLFMIIYDTTQSIKKKSAMEQANIIYRNGAEIGNLLRITANKVKVTDELNLAKPAIVILLSMIKDNYTGKYKITESELISTIACLIYFNEPYTTTQDIINGKEDISDIDMMLFLLNILKEQIYNYKRFEEQNKSKAEKVSNH